MTSTDAAGEQATRTARRTASAGEVSRSVVVRADSGFYSHKVVAAAVDHGAYVSIGVSLFPAIRRKIDFIAEDQWTTITYTQPVLDPDTNTWIHRAQVAETEHVAFTKAGAKHPVTGRLVVRRVPAEKPTNQQELLTGWRYHAFFTTLPAEHVDTVAADKLHRRHAVIEQVHADLKASALAHLPSGVFAANAAWLHCAVIAFNLTRAAATLTRSPRLARATTATIRRTLITVPARIARSARRLTLHLPQHWPWENEWNELFDNTVRRKPA